jgi:hypothetical protein
MGIYADLTTGGVSTGVAADLVGVPRETAIRKPPIPVRGRAVAPANKLDCVERARILKGPPGMNVGRLRDPGP